MKKVVYSACYGGFGLSKEACQRYWDLKGKQVWIEDNKECPSLGFFTVWLTPPENRIDRDKDFYSMPIDERIAYNKQLSAETWNDRDVVRHDPILVQVVEELGERANGRYAKLRIAEVNSPYRIDEYDGCETVETPDSYEWIVPE